ncbi:MAG: biotin/lipoate A/B protein ligase family protein [Chloroflexota bacterium]
MRLRLLDLGGVSGLRSQAVYHALCDSVSAGGPDTLAILFPTNPYVSVGFHRDLEAEVDLSFCASHGLPVYRRRVGGGTVYLDADQVFFQLVVHERHVRMSVDRAYAELLAPAAVAYRALGVVAERLGINDLAVDGRKLSGTGMASIGDAVVLVGNVILDVDHAAMAGILRLPDSTAAAWVEASMRRWVTSIRGELGTVPTYDEVARQLRAAYGAWAGEPLEVGRLSQREEELIRATEERLVSPDWLHRDGYERTVARPSPVRRVKIRARRWDAFFDWESSAGSIRTSISADDGVIEAVRFAPDDGLREMAAALVGRRSSEPGIVDLVAGTVGTTVGLRLAELLAIATRPEG